MSSTNKTQKLQLNQWDAADRPQRNDFNSDNLIIDRVLGDHVDNTAIHLTSAEKARVQNPMAVTGYLGNGEAERTVTLPIVANAVVVYCDGMPCAIYDSTAAATNQYYGIAVQGGGSTSGITLASGKVIVKNDTAATGGVLNRFNESGRQYKVLAIR